MKRRRKKPALTLVEMMAVIAVMALLTGLAIPAIKALLDSMADSGAARTMVEAALSSARAIALKERKYAGIRFQKRYPEGPKDPQYMVFIISDNTISPGKQGSVGCRIVEGFKPVKLPKDIIISSFHPNTNDPNKFSVLFSPSGRLVIHKHWVKSTHAQDDVFNTPAQIENGFGMFVESLVGQLEPKGDIELSRRQFELFDLNNPEKGSRRFWIAPYTGELIEMQN